LNRIRRQAAVILRFEGLRKTDLLMGRRSVVR
jgi:hypothetical protein